MISAAICWASAALPPLPMIRSLLPERSAAMMAAAILRAVASNAASCVARSSAASDCFKWAPIRSWLNMHRKVYNLASVVMTASQARKLAVSVRNACSGLVQHALCNRDYVGCRNVAHAAMIVHGTDWTVARLAGHDRFGLNRRRKPVQRRPVIRAGGAENTHGRRAQSGGNVHQAGIVGDRDIGRRHRQNAIA